MNFSTASAGLSYNKFLAKLASDDRSPPPSFVITPKMGPAFVEDLLLGKLDGVGPATTAKMNRLGIENGLDLRAQTLPFLQRHFGKVRLRPIIGSRAALMNGRSAPAAFASRWGGEYLFAGPACVRADAEALEPIIAKVWRHCQADRHPRADCDPEGEVADFSRSPKQIRRPPVDSLADLERLSLGLLEPLLPPKKGCACSGSHFRL